MSWLLLLFSLSRVRLPPAPGDHLADHRLPLLSAIVGPRACRYVGRQVVETLTPALLAWCGFSWQAVRRRKWGCRAAQSPSHTCAYAARSPIGKRGQRGPPAMPIGCG